MLLALLEDLGDVLLRVLDLLNLDDTTEEDIGGGVGERGRDDTGAVDEVDALHEGDVLPDLGLAGDGGDSADLLGAEGIDDRGFAGVGVADKTDGDLFALGVEGGELAEELDEGAFAEGVVDVGVEGEGGVVLGQAADPGSLNRSSVHVQQKTVGGDVRNEMSDEGMCVK